MRLPRRAAYAGTAFLLAMLVVASARASATVPPPNLAQVVPPNYRVLKVLHAKLSGQAVAEVVVTSVGPLNKYELHPADLQVLSWDPLGSRWNVVFDAQKVRYGSEPLMDPRGAGHVDQIAFVHFLSGVGKQLVFTASMSYGGSGVPGELVIVDFQQDEATIDYVWSADRGGTFRVTGSPTRPTLLVTATYWTPADDHFDPVRSYHFTIGFRQGFQVLSDDRPWVGLYVTATHPGPPLNPDVRSPLRVLRVVPHSPAAPAFRTHDVIVAVKGLRVPKNETSLLGPALLDDVAVLRAGEKARFTVQRGGRQITLSVRLRSLIDPSATATLPPRTGNSFAI